MFTLSELLVIARGLTMSEASAKRLSAREGQPVEVQSAYTRSIVEISEVHRKVLSEVSKLQMVKK